MDVRDIEQCKNAAKRDDWHMHFVGSDIRWMLGEIERLREQLDATEKALREQDGMEYFGKRFDRAMDRADKMLGEIELVRTELAEWKQAANFEADLRREYMARFERLLLAKDLWLPIDTAPKDGTKILIYTATNDTIIESWWFHDEQYDIWGWINPFIGFGRAGMNASHWRPSPERPTVTGDQLKLEP